MGVGCREIICVLQDHNGGCLSHRYIRGLGLERARLLVSQQKGNRMKKIMPIKDFVVMTIPETKSAIALPEGVQVNKEAYMVAIAVGPDVKSIQVGDRVVTLKGTVVGIPVEGKNYYMAKEELIMGIITEEKDPE